MSKTLIAFICLIIFFLGPLIVTAVLLIGKEWVLMFKWFIEQYKNWKK